MDKKGFTLSLTELVRITIAAILLIAFFASAYLLYNAIFGGKALDEKDNLNALADQIELMLSRDTTFEYAKMILTIQDKKYVIRGYSSDVPTKPELCQDKTGTCLCLAESKDDGIDKAIFCKSPNHTTTGVLMIQLGSREDIRTQYPETVPGVYTYLRIANKERTGTVSELDLSKGGLFYIEKFVTPSATHILVTLESSEPTFGLTPLQVKQRIDALSPCPEGSDTQCQNLLRNSKSGAGFCKFENDKCVYAESQPCAEGEETISDCICGSSLILPGLFCLKNERGEYYSLKISCSKVSSCAEYCHVEGNYQCTREEETFCALNPCRLAEKCVVDTNIPEEMGETVYTTCTS